MTRGKITKNFLGEIKGPLARAVNLLRPHYDEVSEEWSKKLRASGLNDQEIETLRALSLESVEHFIEEGNAEKFRAELQREALQLEANGVPEAQIITAM